jgi:hypothetical protein
MMDLQDDFGRLERRTEEMEREIQECGTLDRIAFAAGGIMLLLCLLAIVVVMMQGRAS